MNNPPGRREYSNADSDEPEDWERIEYVRQQVAVRRVVLGEGFARIPAWPIPPNAASGDPGVSMAERMLCTQPGTATWEAAKREDLLQLENPMARSIARRALWEAEKRFREKAAEAAALPPVEPPPTEVDPPERVLDEEAST